MRPSGKSAAKSDVQSVVSFDDKILAFGIDFYKAAGQEFGDGNWFFSPYSLGLALTMLHAGTRGETAEQLAVAMYFDNNPEQMDDMYKASIEQLKALDKDGQKVKIHNQLWVEQTFKIEEPYTQVLKERFFAEAGTADFINNPDAQREIINKKVTEQTDGMINELLAASDIDALVRLVLVNTLYFQGTWKTQFKAAATKDEDFVVSPEKTVKVPMMHHKLLASHFENDLVRGVELPYGDGDFAMMIMMPAQKNTLADVEAKMTSQSLPEWWKTASMQELDLKMPRYKAGGDISAPKVLRALGIVDIFEEQKANLTDIYAGGGLFVSQVAHQAKLEVDENGSKAAAATAVVASYRSAPLPPKEFLVNRPFVVAIFKKGPQADNGDRAIGTLMFLGRISDPTI